MHQFFRWPAAAVLGFSFTAMAAPCFAQAEPIAPDVQADPSTDVQTDAPAKVPTAESLLQVDGELTEGDDVVPEDNSFYDVHTFEGEAGQVVTIAMESQEFDTFLWLFGPDSQELAQNDDEGMTSDSAIALTLPQTGTYTIGANAHSEGMVGQYRITVHVEPEL
ncbi:MAG: PPC domain-containing protein [Elainellaceae cyanobacterium]